MSETPISRKRELKWIRVDQIYKNERNPREKQAFDPDELASLRRSIQAHGILEPLIVQPYDDDMYLLVEGERRWTVARDLGIEEVPAVLVNRMSEHDQVVVMFNVHTNRRAWERIEELRALKELRDRNGDLSEDELAKELGMTLATLKDRLRVQSVIEEDPTVVRGVSKGLDYSSVLRSDEAAKTITTQRPELAERLGGRAAIRRRLLDKATPKRGVSQELVEAKKDLRDPTLLSDELVEEYVKTPEARISDIRRKASSLQERRQIEDVTREVLRLDRELTLFHVEFEAAPNLRELRNALATLIVTAQGLEGRVTDAIHKQEDPGR